jgi:hypothetical protein
MLCYLVASQETALKFIECAIAEVYSLSGGSLYEATGVG